MGKSSDYSILEAAPEMTYDLVKEKFGKDPMSASEFAAYLGGMENSRCPYIQEKSIRNYIDRICKRSNGLLTKDDFKIGKKYVFPPEIHGLLLTLFNTDSQDRRKNDRLVATRLDLYRQLIDNVDTHLPAADKEQIQSSPAYLNAILESTLSKRINEELTLLLRALYHLDPALRYRQMNDFLNTLTAFRKELYTSDTRAMTIRTLFAHDFDEAENAAYQRSLFRAETLDQLLISCLAAKMDRSPAPDAADSESVSMPALAAVSTIFEVPPFDAETVKAAARLLESTASDAPRYLAIMEKAERILDPEDPLERQIYHILDRLAKAQFLCPQLSPQDYQATVRYTESCIADTKWDLLNKLVKLGRQSYSKEEWNALREINPSIPENNE